VHEPAYQDPRLSLEAQREIARGVPLVLPTHFPGPVSWPTVFGTDRPLELELGFGRPHFLLERAAEAPDRNIVGIEWKGRWSRQANARRHRLGLDNVCAIHGNAWILTGGLFRRGELDAAYLNFPDPWWKSKHRKRRIMNDAFARLLADRLRPGGTILVQTDVASLLEQILEALESTPLLRNTAGAGRLCPRKPTRARSHREKKCVGDGVPVFRALLERVSD